MEVFFFFSFLYFFSLLFFSFFSFFFFSFLFFCFVLFYFILFYFILFYFILFYFILFYFILIYFILFCFVYLFTIFPFSFISTNSVIFILGTENAMKSASHELIGLDAYFTHGLRENVHFPLLCVIDYGGYRLLASSQLPISGETLVYGSGNAGKTVNFSPNLLFPIYIY